MKVRDQEAEWGPWNLSLQLLGSHRLWASWVWVVTRLVLSILILDTGLFLGKKEPFSSSHFWSARHFFSWSCLKKTRNWFEGHHLHHWGEAEALRFQAGRLICLLLTVGCLAPKLAILLSKPQIFRTMDTQLQPFPLLHSFPLLPHP